ncbi:MAG: TonB-dependent receptor plug domain-containing protein, partial [Gammaproteobacteria bacterium]
MKKIGPVAAVALMAAGGAARAQQPVPLADLQVTASRSEVGTDAAAQAVTVVTAAQIERAAPQTWTDLLRGQPGAFTQASGPGQGIVIVRGLKGSEVLHLVDGMRLDNSFFRNSPSQYIVLVDPYNAARVELQRGPGAVLYGSDAMGGVVQILTPEHRFDGSDWQTAGKLRLQYGSAEASRTGRIEGAAGRRDLSLAAGLTFMDYGTRDLGGGGREALTDYLARGYDAKLLWTPTAPHELTLSGQRFEYPKLARYFDVAGGPGGAGDDLQSYFQPNDRSFVHARYRYAAPLGVVHGIEAHLARQIIDDDRLRQPDASRIDTEQNRSTLDGFTLQAWSPLGEALVLRYGVDLYRDTLDSAKQRTTLADGATREAISTFPDGARQDSSGIYVLGECQASLRWRVDAGLRYSHVATELPATPVSRAAAFPDDDLTWQLGSRFALTPQLTWTATAARGFRAPNLFDLGT